MGCDANGELTVPQVIFYQNGIGTGSPSLYDKYIGGATGEGLAENIREAYAFICLNYSPGDEIFLVGFSRGAFTARSISSLIRAVGLLTADGMKYFYQIFEDWEYQLKEGWSTSFPNEPWSHRPPISSPEYMHKLLELELTRPDIPIKAVAVWDTVGGLGIPMIGLFPQPPSKDFSFVDTKVEPNIEHAFQALALDERRRSYAPTIWEKPASQPWPKVLKQSWFPGVHSDIGGSYSDADLANITLAWMVSQLSPLLDFNHDYVLKQVRLSNEKHIANKTPIRDWGLGKIHDSLTLFFRLGGTRTRTPSEYTAIDPRTFKSTGKRLQNTNETVHSSVRIRMGREGLGYDDKGSYASSALQGWTMYGEETAPDTPIQQTAPGPMGAMTKVVWKKMTRGEKGREEEIEMPEEELGAFEKQILQLWPEIKEHFGVIRPGSDHPTRIGRGKTFPLLGRKVDGVVGRENRRADDLRVVTGSAEQRPVRTGTV